ncbi:MAG: MazG nucleotide pyrophosphohydrolase domain-containing protein [Pigmentiphaga sp.]
MSYLQALGEEIHAVNRANGWEPVRPDDWHDIYIVPAILALIHSEVSEALEAFRTGDRENFAEELADVAIRVLDCATGLGIDLDKEIRAKVEKNRRRAYRHGDKRI